MFYKSCSPSLTFFFPNFYFPSKLSNIRKHCHPLTAFWNSLQLQRHLRRKLQLRKQTEPEVDGTGLFRTFPEALRGKLVLTVPERWHLRSFWGFSRLSWGKWFQAVLCSSRYRITTVLKVFEKNNFSLLQNYGNGLFSNLQTALGSLRIESKWEYKNI